MEKEEHTQETFLESKIEELAKTTSNLSAAEERKLIEDFREKICSQIQIEESPIDPNYLLIKKKIYIDELGDIIPDEEIKKVIDDIMGDLFLSNKKPMHFHEIDEDLKEEISKFEIIPFEEEKSKMFFTSFHDHPKPHHIVMMGGGIKAIAHIGAVKFLEDFDLKKDVKSVIGTSAGSLIALLFALGLDSGSMIEYVTGGKVDFSKLKDIGNGSKGFIGCVQAVVGGFKGLFEDFGVCKGAEIETVVSDFLICFIDFFIFLKIFEINFTTRKKIKIF